MFERFTELARQVVPLALRESDRLGHNYIGCEHFLVGLAQQPGRGAARVLDVHRLDVHAVQRGLDRLVDQGILPPPRHTDKELLGGLGVDLDAVLHRMADSFGPDLVNQAVVRATGGGWTPWCGKAFEVKQALWFADKQAQALGQTSISPEHLLFGVLRDARNPVDKPRCFRNSWQRRRRARLGLPQRGPSPVRLIVEQQGLSLEMLCRAALAELRATSR
ncbi:MAG: Clp protease N-terminal domain-containing protein [Pseudonocardiaceae bacterium]